MGGPPSHPSQKHESRGIHTLLGAERPHRSSDYQLVCLLLEELSRGAIRSSIPELILLSCNQAEILTDFSTRRPGCRKLRRTIHYAVASISKSNGSDQAQNRSRLAFAYDDRRLPIHGPSRKLLQTAIANGIARDIANAESLLSGQMRP